MIVFVRRINNQVPAIEFTYSTVNGIQWKLAPTAFVVCTAITTIMPWSSLSKRYFSQRDFGKNILVAGLLSGLDLEKDDQGFENFKSIHGLLIDDKWERVKVIFKKNEYGEMHVELVKALRMTQNGFWFGVLFGGVTYTLRFHDDFQRTSDYKTFTDFKQAYRSSVNHSLQGFVKGAMKVAPLFAVFTGSYSILSSCIQAYRNKCGIIEYSLGGCGVGAMFRFNYGLRGMIAGGVVGSALGTIYGVVQTCVLKLFGLGETEWKYALYTMEQNQKKNQSVSLSLREREPNKTEEEKDSQ